MPYYYYLYVYISNTAAGLKKHKLVERESCNTKCCKIWINGSKIYFQTKIHTIIAGGTKWGKRGIRNSSACGYNIMWWSLSVTCDRSVVYFRYSRFLHHDIAEILLKLALSTITLTPSTRILVYYSFSIYEWIRCRTIKNIKYFSSNLTTGNTVINMFHVTRK